MYQLATTVPMLTVRTGSQVAQGGSGLASVGNLTRLEGHFPPSHHTTTWLLNYCGKRMWAVHKHMPFFLVNYTCILVLYTTSPARLYFHSISAMFLWCRHIAIPSKWMLRKQKLQADVVVWVLSVDGWALNYLEITQCQSLFFWLGILKLTSNMTVWRKVGVTVGAVNSVKHSETEWCCVC